MRRSESALRSIDEAAIASRQEAFGGGDADASSGQETLSPSPATTARPSVAPTTSLNRPACLRSFESTRSLGHLMASSAPNDAAASQAARLSAIGTAPSVVGSAQGTRNDTSSAVAGGASHRRSRRPLPAVWCSAKRTLGAIDAPGSRASTRAARSRFVDSVSATTSTCSNLPKPRTCSGVMSHDPVAVDRRRQSSSHPPSPAANT